MFAGTMAFREPLLHVAKRATDAERILWRHLRNRNFVGYKFRRQHPLGCYVLDFYCPAAKLAIELDGGGHNYRLGQMRDKSRSNMLADQDVIVLRFLEPSSSVTTTAS